MFQFGNAGAAGTGAITTFAGVTISTPTGEVTIANTIVFGVGGYTIILAKDKTSKATFTGTWSGLGGWKKMGDGAIVLPIANSYSYGTELAGGTVLVGHADALSSNVNAGVRVTTNTMVKPIVTGISLTEHDYDLVVDTIIESAFANFNVQGNNRGAGKFILQGGGNITQTPSGTSANNMTGDIVIKTNTTYAQGSAGAITSGKVTGEAGSQFTTDATTGPRLVGASAEAAPSRFIMTF